MIATVTIERCSPESQDPSYSSRGHDPIISSYRVRSRAGLGGWLISDQEIEAFIRDHAPEALTPYRTDTTDYYAPDTHVWRHAKDQRGYHTTVEIWIRPDN